MSWETRGGQVRFYTRSKRVDGRLVREYVGVGIEADAVAQDDERERQERLARIRLAHEERSRLLELDGLIDNYCRQTAAIVSNTLMAAGYRRHNRGKWRKNRVKNK